MNLLNEIRKRIRIPAGDVAVAVSGGADSMFLLALCTASCRSVVAVHINYGLRGRESDADEELVSGYCMENGIKLYTARFRQVDSKTGNFQSDARRFRYQFLMKVLRHEGLYAGLTAHHRSDEDETLLFRLLRDGGSASLPGVMSYNESIIRPLLGITAREIRAAAEEAGIPWREDQSNNELTYSRNRLRNEVIPVLDEVVPGWKNTLRELKQREEVQRQAVRLILSQLLEGKRLNRKEWLKLPAGLRYEVLAAWIFREAGFQPGSGALHLSELAAELKTGHSADAGQNWELLRDRECFLLRQKHIGTSDTFIITLRESDLPAKINPPLYEDSGLICSVKTGIWNGSPDESVLELSSAAVKMPLTIRGWKPGDRMRPLGMSGSKLISDILTDHKISTVRRSKICVAETFDDKICAVIFSRKYDGRPGLISSDAACSVINEKTLIISEEQHPK